MPDSIQKKEDIKSHESTISEIKLAVEKTYVKNIQANIGGVR